VNFQTLPPKQELTEVIKHSKNVHFNYILHNRAFIGDLNKEEVKELALEYGALDGKYRNLLLAYTSLLLDNSRLVNENEFMLKLMNEKVEV